MQIVQILRIPPLTRSFFEHRPLHAHYCPVACTTQVMPYLKYLLSGLCCFCIVLPKDCNASRVRVWSTSVSAPNTPPEDLTNAVQIACGARHPLALKADGTVVSWGQNTYGQTNTPAGLGNVVAVDGGEYHSVALKADGTVVAWGRN